MELIAAQLELGTIVERLIIMNTLISPVPGVSITTYSPKRVPPKQFFACILRKNEFTVKILLTKIKEHEIIYKNDI